MTEHNPASFASKAYALFGTHDSLRLHLRQLTTIRSLVLAFFCCAFAASFYIDSLSLPTAPILTILLALGAWHGYTHWRLHGNPVVTRREFFTQLLIDVVCLNLIFYFSGGATNPFISYLLVPVCICAATLPWLYTWIITTLCVIAYTLLLFFHVPLAVFAFEHAHEPNPLNWHIVGMWCNFFVSAVLITYFVVKMARHVREQEARITQMREDELRSEQLIAVATLAAGAAHEINTPLATMTVLLAEMRADYTNNPALTADLTLLYDQVNTCAASLKHIVQDACISTPEHSKLQSCQEFCTWILDRWQLLRPGVNYQVACGDALSNRMINQDIRLDHAIINLLNNAADANPDNIFISIDLAENDLIWLIYDKGPGIANGANNQLGKTPFTTKESGLGIGLILSHSTINSCGGRVTQHNNDPVGTVTTIRLPLHRQTKLPESPQLN
jgi:two-component system, sensor histidine kinase RegB